MTQTPLFPFTVSDAMNRAMLDAGETPTSVSEKLGVAYRTVLRWLNGEKAPGGKNLAAFIELTGADWLPFAIADARRRNRCSGNFGALTSGGETFHEAA